jgi:ABC-2 type transport system ATP-binding protein
MPDYFGTYPNVDCYEYLDFFARAYGLVGRERHQAVRHTMSFTGLDALADKPIRALSKGMKQRLCLGRSMIHNPSVLVLDEPAAGLDPRARVELRAMIRQLAADGKSILVSSHILTEMAEMCDRVGIIEQGRLLATGTVAEIQRGQTPQSEVRIRMIGGGESLHTWLRQRTDVQNVVVEGEHIRFTHDGGREEQSELLRQLVHAGFRIDEFATHQKSLEDVFMQVTHGAVQ